MKNTGQVRKKHSADFKFKIAMAIMSGKDTIQEICSQYGIIAAQAYAWKKQLQESGSEIFERGSKKKTVDPSEGVHKLHATIGKLKVENDFLVKFLNKCH